MKRRRARPGPFGKALTRLRKEKGFNSYRLAKEAGLPLPTVRRIELTPSNPQWDVVLKLAAALGVGVEAFQDKPKETQP